jgi:hypothetical protein
MISLWYALEIPIFIRSLHLRNNFICGDAPIKEKSRK